MSLSIFIAVLVIIFCLKRNIFVFRVKTNQVKKFRVGPTGLSYVFVTLYFFIDLFLFVFPLILFLVPFIRNLKSDTMHLFF